MCVWVESVMWGIRTRLWETAAASRRTRLVTIVPIFVFSFRVRGGGGFLQGRPGAGGVGFLVTRGRLGFFLCRLGEEVHLKIAPAGSGGRVVGGKARQVTGPAVVEECDVCGWLNPCTLILLNCSISKRRGLVWFGLFNAKCQDGREGMEKTRRSSSCNAKRT